MWAVMRLWTAADSIARLRGVERVFIIVCSCRFVCKSKVVSFGKSGLDGQHTVAGLIHEFFCRTDIAGNHFFSVLESASQGGLTFL